MFKHFTVSKTRNPLCLKSRYYFTCLPSKYDTIVVSSRIIPPSITLINNWTKSHGDTSFSSKLCSHRNYSSPSFVDKVKCVCEGGSGGDGIVSFRRERAIEKGGPDGGDGGKGGDVILQVSGYIHSGKRIKSLDHIRHFQKAEKGGSGGSRLRKGKDGKHLFVYVPMGTVVRDADTGNILADLNKPDDHIVIAKGGSGGHGNKHFATSSNRTPYLFSKGKVGEKKLVELELKSIADIGLVGYPNAGKSTFLRSVSNANPEVAPYPFTTLHPTIGIVELEDYFTFTIADLPGLIEGAHADVGLGHDFLKHVERTKLIVYVVDVSGLAGMGIQRSENNTYIYKFPNPEENPPPDLESSTPYIDYSETFNVNTEMEKKTRFSSLSEWKSNIAADYGLEEESLVRIDTTTQNGNSKSNARSALKEQKLREQKQQKENKKAKTAKLVRKYDNYEIPEDSYLKELKMEQVRNEIKQKKDKIYMLESWEVLEKLEHELETYIPGLSKKARIVIANKIDVPGAAKNLDILKQKSKLPVFPVSALNQENLQSVLHYCKKLLLEEKLQEKLEQEDNDDPYSKT